MTNSKMTYKTAVAYAIANLPDAPADVIEKLEALTVQLDKRANAKADRKPTEKQEKNLADAHLVADFLRENGPATCAEMRSKVEDFANFTPQKMAGVCKIGKEAGLIDKFIDKRTTYWKVVEG